MASNMERKYDSAFHTICLLINIAGCSYEIQNINLPIFNSYGGRFKFLTHWSQYLHLSYFCFAFGIMVYSKLALGRSKKTGENDNPASPVPKAPTLHLFRDAIFVAICFPIGIMVCFLFWGITFVTADKDGATSAETRKIVPLSSPYNHYLHTAPLILNLLGIFLVKFTYPSRKYGVSVVSTFSILYVAWLVHVGKYTGFWSYPFIEHQTMIEFIAFVIGSALAAVAVYIFGEALSSVIWGGDKTKKGQ